MVMKTAATPSSQSFRSKANAYNVVQQPSSQAASFDAPEVFTFEDHRPDFVAQRKLCALVTNSPQVERLSVIQEMVNKSSVAAAQWQRLDRDFLGKEPVHNGIVALSSKLGSASFASNQPHAIANLQHPPRLASGTVLQAAFKSEEHSKEEVDKWAEDTKGVLENNGEALLLRLFKWLEEANKSYEWDITEDYVTTRLKLIEKLEESEKTPPLTLTVDDQPVETLKGEKSATGYRRLTAWDFEDRGALDASTHTAFSHVTFAEGNWMKERVDTMHGADSGELGAGFYTVEGHNDVGTKGIRDEFGKTGKVPREVLTFRIANVELRKMVNDDEDLAKFLIYVLQHANGYPENCGNPIDLIQRINKIGKALIFPDKTTAVEIDEAGTRHSYDSYRAINGGVGSHSLIIGPQARESLDGIRQICARGYLGDKLINEATRSRSTLGPRGT